MREEKKGGLMKCGITTTKQTKPAMTLNLQKIMRESRLYFHDEFCTAMHEYCPYDDLRDYICKELSTFYRVLKYSKTDETKKPTVIFTGKLDGGKDDLVMAIMINVLSRIMFFERDVYKRYW